MPLYAYRCPVCNAEQDEFNRIAERETGAPDCPDHGKMLPIISPVRGIVQAECHFICSATEGDIPVTTHRQRANIMAEHNLIDARELDYSKRIAQKKAQTARDLEEARANLPPIDLTPYAPALPA